MLKIICCFFLNLNSRIRNECHVPPLTFCFSLAPWQLDLSSDRMSPRSDVSAGHRPAINVGTFWNVDCQFLQQLPLKLSGLHRPPESRNKILLPCLHYIREGAGAQAAAEWKAATLGGTQQTSGWFFCIRFPLHAHFLEPQLDCLASLRYWSFVELLNSAATQLNLRYFRQQNLRNSS